MKTKHQTRYCVPCKANREIDQLHTSTHDTPEGKAIISQWRCCRCGEITEFRTFVDRHGEPVLRAYNSVLDL